jgi:hypothetical protein
MREFRRTIKRAGGDMQDFTNLNRDVGSIVAHRAQPSTPVGPGIRGHISRTVRSSGTRTAAIVRAGNNTSFRYANPIHWGWHRRNIRPNPWISRAAQATEPQWRSVILTGIDRILHKIKGK